MARRNWLVAGFVILVAWGMVSISFQGCSSTPAGPVTVTQGVTVIATPPPSGVPGKDWTFKTLSAAFSARYLASGLVYNGQMWVVGGYVFGNVENDVWSSSDGANWNQILANNASPGPNQFPRRELQTSVPFNNKMWVIGGEDSSSNYLNDVWSSTDGVNWTNVLAQNASPGPNQFPSRYYHTTLVYNNKLWVIGGVNAGGTLNDVWSSPDGITWTQVLADTASPGIHQFSRRDGQSGLVYNGKMWVIGGYTAGLAANDVWSSTDGITWTNVLNDTASPGAFQFSRRYSHTSLVYGNAMWVIAGYTSPNVNDAWYSVDGQSWYEATASAAFPARNSSIGLVFNNAMWMISGSNNATLSTNDVWYSPF